MVTHPQIPSFARRRLDAEGVSRIESAIRKAEQSTTGEFVAVVVRGSCGDAHVPMSVSLSALMAAFLWHSFMGEPSLPLLLCELAAAALLGLLLSRVEWFDRFFTPLPDRQRLCFRRARLEFYQHGLEKTKGATGILLFVSLADRIAYVLADKSIASKVPSSVWEEVTGLVIEGIKAGDLAGGLEKGVTRSGEIVRPYFPRRGRNRNELSDRVVIKD